MDTSPNYCESCGSQLPPEVKFCLQCGSPVSEEPLQLSGLEQTAPVPPPSQPAAPPYTPPQPYTPPPAYAPPPARSAPPPARGVPAPVKKSRLPCFLIGGAALIGLICLGIVAVGAFLYFYPLNRDQTAVVTEVVTELAPTETIELAPTDLPTEPSAPPTEPVVEIPTEAAPPTEAPAQPTVEPPDATIPSPGGGSTEAFVNDFSIFDPFNDNQLGWKVDDSGDLTTLVEQSAYSLYTRVPSTYFWVYPPVDFDPIVIEYEAWVDPATSTQDYGTYGVICNYQDNENFTYVEIDPSDGTVYFARFQDDVETSLRDDEWTDSEHLFIGAGELNHISVECYPDSINLFINNAHETLVNIDPPTIRGRSAIMIGTWDTLDPNGYKVYFDNFYAYIPQQ